MSTEEIATGGSINKDYKGALEAIARQFKGIEQADLTRAEKNVLAIAVITLGWTVKKDEFDQIDF